MTSDPARWLASELARRGLAAPARLLADAHRPLGPLLSDLGAAFGPLIRAAAGPAGGAAADLLDDPAALDRVVHELDGEMERHGQPG